LLVGHDCVVGREVGEKEGETRAGESHTEGQDEGGADHQAGQDA
jgi:hypothetical protein